MTWYQNKSKQLKYLGSGDGNNDDVNEKRFENCCCVSVSRSCPNPRNNGGSSGGNSGFLSAASPRFGPEANVTEDDIGSRIVNKVCLI